MEERKGPFPMPENVESPFSSPAGVLLSGGFFKYSIPNFKNIIYFTIPSNIYQIEDKAFYECVLLKNIIIPNSVTYIGHYVFYQCSSLTKIIIPNSVTKMGYYVFLNVHRL